MQRRRLRLTQFLTLALVALAVVSEHSFSEGSFLDPLYETLGYVLLLVAAMGRVWCSAFIAGKKSRELVRVGPYSIVRNPLYFFTFLGLVGAGLAFESMTLAVGFGAVFFLTHWSTILGEERKLAGIFGAEFETYVSEVPRFVPHPWKLTQPETATFSPRVFTRAVLECSLVPCVWLIAHAIEWAHEHGVIPVLVRLP
jgi:protein-S-isoprenylcysteine O-methyltransferase Ste14